MKEILKRVAIGMILFYQKNISPFIGRHCRFIPTCSEYTLISIKKYGLIKGILKGIKRILRCHPFGKKGIDLP